jgi:hypothetical protein
MNKMTFAAIAVAAILLIAGAYVVMSIGKGPGADGDTDQQPDAVDSEAKTLAVAFPVEIGSDDRKMALSMAYPGKGESGYTYNWGEVYRFNLTASQYTGNVLIKMFAELTDPRDEIDEKQLTVTDAFGKTVNWTANTRTGHNINHIVISGDIVAWKANGSASVRSFEVKPIATGNLSLTVQAFDLDSGKAISDPVTANMYIPVQGSLTFRALFHGEWNETANGTYYRILINVVNDWNIRYSVDPANFSLYNGTEWVPADTEATFFKGQSLAPEQSTQFFVYFNTTGERNDFSLRYDDPRSGTINIPLPPPVGDK